MGVETGKWKNSESKKERCMTWSQAKEQASDIMCNLRRMMKEGFSAYEIRMFLARKILKYYRMKQGK